ncbi:nuclear transport factor 2 family protein [Amycolatopsis jejuensis]|uniref:nuclear transport factor 2 family protein n=1 Tax=Amycolatopsis jejuensis TaxID=330084 RepID=UPI0005240FAF|nr:nuclear transport factor 2 family protein [Amycolatopsis jejuensis]
MSEREDFVAWFRSGLREAEVAIHNGDSAPRRAIWSRGEPVTVFGAWQTVAGQEGIDRLFKDLAARFSGCESYEQELDAAEVSGDVAYTVSYEHSRVSVDGQLRQYTLRVTQIYRLEDGEWKVVHRHGDTLETTDL